MSYQDNLPIFKDIELCRKDFENKFCRISEDIFQNGELHPESATDFLFDYYENYNEVFENNQLSRRAKILIALAVASAVNQPYCITVYFNEATENGWSKEQIREALYVAAAVYSGFSSVHAIQKINDLPEMVM